METKINKKATRFMLAVLAATVMAGCTKHDEINFEGEVVFVQSCSFNVSPSSAGYAVQLDSPEEEGVSLTYLERTYSNVVLLFDPGRILQAGDRVRGTFYFDDKASRQYCELNNLNDLGVPQGIFVEVHVD